MYAWPIGQPVCLQIFSRTNWYPFTRIFKRNLFKEILFPNFVHYEDETSGDYKPTKKGIAVNPKILPEVVEMMVQAAESLYKELLLQKILIVL